MQTQATIPAEHADLWGAARAWFRRIASDLFVSGFTAVGDGKRPELIGWLGEIERIVRWLLVAAALAVRPDEIQPEPRDAKPDGSAHDQPVFAGATPMPAFLALPPAPRPRLAAMRTPADHAAPTPPRLPLTADLGGELIVRFLVLQRVMTHPERLIRRLALRLAARIARGARTAINWAVNHLKAQPSVLMHGLAEATHGAALDAVALYASRNPEPG